MTSRQEDIVLTIFTPAFNRAHLLPRLFDSIASQVSPGDLVEWLVIDDGSIDDTFNVLEHFAAQRPDLVRGLCVENGGKHRAINRAAREARGKWMMLVDSDDALVDGAVKSVFSAIERFASNSTIGLVRGLKVFPDRPRRRFEFVTSGVVMTHSQWISSQESFDSAELVRCTALRMYPFPEYPGEHFIAESWLWHALDETHRIVCLNEPWVRCWYQAEGLSANALKVRIKSPNGTLDVYEAIYRSSARFQLRARAAINWWRYRFHVGSGGVRSRPHPSRIFVMPGVVLFMRDRFRIFLSKLS
jgi:glycosyltransferase involved in cell wall biosynthesis